MSGQVYRVNRVNYRVNRANYRVNRVNRVNRVDADVALIPKIYICLGVFHRSGGVTAQKLNFSD